MSRIMKFFTTIRNNWKKSVVGAAAFSYGVSYSIESYDTEQLMRQYSEEAVKYGDQPLPTNIPLRHVTVILNPVAKKRKAKKLFEKYCEPLLHLAGISVTIIQTQKEGQARSLIENLETPTDAIIVAGGKAKKLFEKYCEPLLHLAGISVTIIQTQKEGQARSLIENLETPTDAIIVAGGDGTLSDVVTGLMRKYQANVNIVKKCPIGILPLGQTNRMADTLFKCKENLADVREMADATMAIVKGATKTVDVVELDPLEKDPENPIKPVYAVGVIEWGAWRDAQSRLNKYWYWGYLRRYVTYIFTGYKKDVNWDCNAKIRYSEPCHGCSRCYQENNSSDEVATTSRRWWQAFVPRKIVPLSGPDYSKVNNVNCGELREIPISTTELLLSTGNVRETEPQKPPSIEIQLGPEKVSYTEFVAEGWRRANGKKSPPSDTLEAKNIEIVPIKPEHFEDKEQMFSIDNEEFELKPVKIRLLPKSVTMFCSQLES